MSETKFTPGPLVVKATAAPDVYLVGGNDRGIIAKVNGRGDANLYRAAPDLYEALSEQVGECLDPLCDMCSRHDRILAKARGES